jgi:hypothetical protein
VGFGIGQNPTIDHPFLVLALLFLRVCVCALWWWWVFTAFYSHPPRRLKDGFGLAGRRGREAKPRMLFFDSGREGRRGSIRPFAPGGYTETETVGCEDGLDRHRYTFDAAHGHVGMGMGRGKGKGEIPVRLARGIYTAERRGTRHDARGGGATASIFATRNPDTHKRTTYPQTHNGEPRVFFLNCLQPG